MTAMIRTMVGPTLHAIEHDEFNAFITIDREGALAARSDSLARRQAGRALGPLDGVPVAIKDCIDTAGLRTTIGSGMYADRVPNTDATVVRRLKAAGVIIVGKTNCTELCCGTTGANAWFGDVMNPHDTTRYTGGSSSGSAAAVAAGLVPMAIGTDTSCSIRHPAAACGVVGFKPTFGRVSTEGVSVCATPLDHVGPIARSVDDAATLLAAMQSDGWDDPTEPARSINELDGLRIGILQGPFYDLCEPDVQAAFDDAIDVLRRRPWHVEPVDLGLDLETIDHEANLLCADLVTVYGADVAAAPAGVVGDELRFWFDAVADVDTDRYAEALAVRDRVTIAVEAAFDTWDVLLCPTIRKGAGLLAEAAAEDRMPRMGNCSLWDMTGQPSLTVPLGGMVDGHAGPSRRDRNGMPLGLLINTRRDADALALQMGRIAESALA